MTDYRDRLRQIRTFPSLVKFLRDDLDWPIDSTDDFEDLTFDYTPAELGIDHASAAKIEEIKRLRPLVANQPWGIFFVKFEPKQLPVVALRRILNGVVVKKRATASAAEQQKWAPDDLLFISNYGEDDERRISFAHFSQDPAKGELPTLRVLAWDDLDTPLHLDHAADTLVERLSWPTADADLDYDAWRERWRSAFQLRHREVVTTSKALAEKLAQLARAIRGRIRTVLEIETDHGPITELMQAFRDALVHDLDEDGFADMYAQTIAYGLLSARVAGPKGADVGGALLQLPVTNPFLRELMETFMSAGGDDLAPSSAPRVNFDELGVSEVVELLDDANMEAVVRDFGDKNPQEDPVIHFYELFLKEYDAKKRMQRGVFYTPRPVVSYIVRSVDDILRTQFGLEDGLADTATWGDMAKRHSELRLPDGVDPTATFVQILDPATGTGTFLVEVIDRIHRCMTDKWRAQGHGELAIERLWNDYVPAHLLPRLHGYELLMAPYAIAHLKIGLKLYETGYQFAGEQRARVYLTNALEPAQDFAGQFDFAIPALAHEAQAVNDVKTTQFFTAILGNPPYANFGQLNRIPFILELLADYKSGLDEKKLNLNDDFIKFVRLCQYHIERCGAGVCGLITNSVFLDGVTHRRMRESLMIAYSGIATLDIHGNSKRGEQAPDGAPDENVFDIQQGVAISLFTRTSQATKCRVNRSDLWGTRDAKYRYLAAKEVRDIDATALEPSAPYFFFAPQGDEALRLEYESGWSTKAIFPVNSDGMQTKRDNLAVQFSEDELRQALRDVVDLNDAELRTKYRLPEDGRDWAVEWARRDVSTHHGRVAEVEYRPFDWRYTYYTGRSKGLIAYPRNAVSAHLLARTNLGLAVNRFVKLDRVSHFLAVKSLVDTHLLETANSCLNVNPLYLLPPGDHGIGVTEPQPNLAQEFLRALATSLGLQTSGAFGLPEGIEPEDIFHYAYAVFGSPEYRTRYSSWVKVDFPRLPLPGSVALFRALAEMGAELVALHVMESPRLDRGCDYVGPANPEVGRVRWFDSTVWIDVTAAKDRGVAQCGTIGFHGVPEAVWEFHIGGYQVCQKWLKDRKGRVLSGQEVSEYGKIVVALAETIRIGRDIDETIDAHGGWSHAFARQGDSV